MILLVLPLLIMALAYWLIAARLWRGLRNETGGNAASRVQAAVEQTTATPLTTCGATCTGTFF